MVEKERYAMMMVLKVAVAVIGEFEVVMREALVVKRNAMA